VAKTMFQQQAAEMSPTKTKGRDKRLMQDGGVLSKQKKKREKNEPKTSVAGSRLTRCEGGKGSKI